MTCTFADEKYIVNRQNSEPLHDKAREQDVAISKQSQLEIALRAKLKVTPVTAFG